MRIARKQQMTLMEIMIVLFIIGSAIGILSYNMKGSLEKGKAFRTAQAQRQVRDILLLAVADGESVDEVVKEPAKYLNRSGLVKDPSSLLKDGWGGAMTVSIDAVDSNDISVYSQHLIEYQRKTGSLKGSDRDSSIADRGEEFNADPVIQSKVK